MTTTPTTLLAMAGADLSPARLTEAALLLIDCQNEYVDGHLALPGIFPALEQTAALLQRARAAEAPIFHVVHQGAAGGLFDPAGHSGAIADAVAAQADEVVVGKRLPNAFAGTDLHDKLKASGRSSIIVCGFMTHMCVSATVRAALDLGWKTTVVGSACATRDLPDPFGGVVAADVLHRAELAALADRFAVVATDQAEVPS